MKSAVGFSDAELRSLKELTVGISLLRWAPCCWKTLNAFFFLSGIPSADLARLMQCVAALIPCPHCAQHTFDHIQRIPIPSDPGAAKAWLVDFHNSVSIKTAATATLTADEVNEECMRTPVWDFTEALWGFLLAVATLFNPESQGGATREFLRFLTIFPDPKVREEVNFDLGSAAQFFKSALNARNRSMEGRRRPLDLHEAIEAFAPPQLYGSLGVQDPRILKEMTDRFAARVEKHQQIRSAVLQRMNPNSLDPDIKAGKLLFRRDDRGTYTRWVAIGVPIVVALVSIIAVGFIMKSYRLKSRPGIG